MCLLILLMFLISAITLLSWLLDINFYWIWSNLIFLRSLWTFLYSCFDISRDIAFSSGLYSISSGDFGSSIYSLIVQQVFIMSFFFLLVCSSLNYYCLVAFMSGVTYLQAYYQYISILLKCWEWWNSSPETSPEL